MVGGVLIFQWEGREGCEGGEGGERSSSAWAALGLLIFQP